MTQEELLYYLSEVRCHYNAGHPKHALELLRDTLDGMFSNHDYESVNMILESTDVPNAHMNVLLTYLDMTLKHKDKLPFREEFGRQVKNKVMKEQPQNVVRLLNSLIDLRSSEHEQ